MLIPVTTDSIVLVDIISRLDGIILIGGADIHPSYYNEEPIEQLGEVDSLRDVYDISLIRLAAQRGVPMLGICRGEQLINVAFGGTLYQDIPAQHPDTTVRHNQEEPSSVPTHAVNLLPDSEMARITGETQLFTNTHHHQAVKQVAPGFRITAWATDSIPEAIENIEGKTIWGVQFHPEALTVAGDSISASNRIPAKQIIVLSITGHIQFPTKSVPTPYLYAWTWYGLDRELVGSRSYSGNFLVISYIPYILGTRVYHI